MSSAANAGGGLRGKLKIHWRSLFRVIDISDGMVYCLVPAWGTSAAIGIPIERFKDFRVQPHPGMRFHAKARIGMEHIEDLDVQDFEEHVPQTFDTADK